MIGMSRIYILVEYNGKWENMDGGFWRWFGVGMSKGFVVDRSINFLELEKTIYHRTSIDRNEYAIEITHKPVGKAIHVHGDDDLNNDGGDALDFHDDYFRCQINEEIPFVASTPINEIITGFNPTSITGSNPTPETVHVEVPNEDDSVDKASDDVPEEVMRCVKDVMVYPREVMIAVVNILNLKRQDLFH
ncbi:hypothetical protein TIFTF001_026914 [Ficus carica]|uniref:Uncharacterized protein n=1 Tax=Ficus carica TaxID=3494 RepID=A0AA88DMD3_FICCA|nr:hypothetical protein TIFTF001_026914 [Ficus carica]